MRPELAAFRFVLGAPAANTPAEAFARQLEELPMAALPLQAGCAQGGWADTDSVQLTLIGLDTCQGGLETTVMAYFEEVVGGCNCSEDPVHYPAMLRLRLVVAADGAVNTIEPTPE